MVCKGKLDPLNGFPPALHMQKMPVHRNFLALRRVVQLPSYAQFGSQSAVKALGGYQKESLTNV